MLLNNLKTRNIILASQSPRRQQLLRDMGLEFEVRTKEIEENYPPALQREEIPRYLSRLKASAFLPELEENDLLICSDTTVHLDGKVLEKPAHLEEARTMLAALSGKKHEVITAFTIASSDYQITAHEITEVTFIELSREEIDYYVEKYQPLDKAGAYGIQEWIGLVGVEAIKGSYFNVMGLPTHLLFRELAKVPSKYKR